MWPPVEESDKWTPVAGKKANEWRGTAIAFRSTYTHVHTTIHDRGCSLVLSNSKHKWGVRSRHIPHHATLDDTQEIIQHWLRSKAMEQSRLVIGLDANEVFLSSETAQYFPRRPAVRGESILHWMTENSLVFLPQELQRPTHFPY